MRRTMIPLPVTITNGVEIESRQFPWQPRVAKTIFPLSLSDLSGGGYYPVERAGLRLRLRTRSGRRLVVHDLNHYHNPDPQMNAQTDQQLLRDYSGSHSE